MPIRTIGAFPSGTNENVVKIACAQVLPSENGMTGEEGGLRKMERYASKAASMGADGEQSESLPGV